MRISDWSSDVCSSDLDEGQEVEKGDLLFVIDPRPYQAALDQAQAQLQRARAEAKLAQAQDARAQTLIEAKAISREEFETRKAASAQGDAGVRPAEAAALGRASGRESACQYV